MADTIREKILDNVETVLKTITTTNGYVNTISSVQKYAQSGNDLASVPCVIISTGQETLEHRPGFIASAKLNIILDVVTIAQTDTDASLNSLLGDIQKALMADYTRNSNAVNTKIITIIPYESIDGNPYAGLIITIEVEYRYKTTDPTTAV